MFRFTGRDEGLTVFPAPMSNRSPMVLIVHGPSSKLREMRSMQAKLHLLGPI